ncbi:DNA mismatch repair endonuclease MutL [Thalassotalea sp. M1531]|uniref:DNA mismatch repair protein MutL n=1 Tax=Thalassotalea algicola TaxID=2716224 RepID=A0A7Y0L9L4_9GAMM|nr:DNA mismatch repair endonuclease MutL [Thalassotalea algicola]NMP30504.1 DNA mismatch repair endonuclease MutL [Thalassotalea algicola]
MSIQILPARLANQIAAGEVVERPASVVKELVENSLDAGASKIVVDIEKGGAKRIRISDNGCGIRKEELTLALSRHATSKIKDLTDLEAIASLGFRGEALASISSVARLTMTSKPENQESAWQAYAQGRDMEVTIQPAAHPNGTTIEVNDLFFNTPARRKFLRTEKTEFSHIDEVIRRIALARFDVSFVLTHNGKMIRSYRAAANMDQNAKRVGQVCGQKFIENALTIDCQHEGLHLWGWIAKPEFYRAQNDLCYSYVNGRMMRDKLINHGIRQAYAELIPSDGYPAFVLYLELDHKEVDVNVHPAKHEVRFHQGRYVHDFIYSVCHQALQSDLAQMQQSIAEDSYGTVTEVQYQNQEYIKPLQRVAEPSSSHAFSSPKRDNQSSGLAAAAASYQSLMSTPKPSVEALKGNAQSSLAEKPTSKILYVVEPHFAVIVLDGALKLVDLLPIAEHVNTQLIEQRWQQGLVSQPLLLPIVVGLDEAKVTWLNQHVDLIEQAGMTIQIRTGNKVQVRQFPALLREKDVASCLVQVLELIESNTSEESQLSVFKHSLAKVMSEQQYSLESANYLWHQAQNVLLEQLNDLCHLNSSEIDLTSALAQLKKAQLQ